MLLCCILTMLLDCYRGILTMLLYCWCRVQMFARGSEGHMYTALLLQQAYAARVQELDSKVANMPRKTAAMQRRLTQKINELLSGANLANVIYSEAVPCRCGASLMCVVTAVKAAG
jgi:hypothetical protein